MQLTMEKLAAGFGRPYGIKAVWDQVFDVVNLYRGGRKVRTITRQDFEESTESIGAVLDRIIEEAGNGPSVSCAPQSCSREVESP